MLKRQVENLKFAALGYLNNWYWQDKYLVAGLSADKSADERRHCLQKIAGYYRIARSFKKLPDEERLDLALQLLDKVPNPINDVESAVCNLAEQFKEHYGKLAVSAASKFLWFRCHQSDSPVVMYDSQAREYLQDLCGKNCRNYKEYLAAWHEQYSRRKDYIGQACDELIHVKGFSLACDVADEELAFLASESWFPMRVFDWFLWGNGRTDSVSVF